MGRNFVLGRICGALGLAEGGRYTDARLEIIGIGDVLDDTRLSEAERAKVMQAISAINAGDRKKVRELYEQLQQYR